MTEPLEIRRARKAAAALHTQFRIRDSADIDVVARGGKMYEGCQPVPADAWLDHDAASELEIWEDSLGIPGIDGVLSLLWVPERIAGAFDRA